MNCPKCHADIAADAQFCVECGTALNTASTGATVALSSPEGSTRCPACQTLNPSVALFCVNCGRTLSPTVITTALRPSSVTLREAEPVVTLPVPPPPAPIQPLPQPNQLPSVQHQPRSKRNRQWSDNGTATFLIGLAVLFLTGTFWPGILVLLGLVALLERGVRGRALKDLVGPIFLIGLAILFATNTIWPGILVLLGVSALLSRT